MSCLLSKQNRSHYSATGCCCKYGIMDGRTSRQALEAFDDHDSLENGLEQTLEAAIKYIPDDENVEMSWLFLHLDGHFRSEKYLASQQPSQEKSDFIEYELSSYLNQSEFAPH